MSFEMSRKHYAEMYGPTTGDAIRLADTELLAEIEHDYTNYGDEVVFGGGKVIRDGMGQNGQMSRDQDIPDTVITNVVVLDYTGIYKADVALRDGHIFKIGKAGNPDITNGVNITIGAATDIIDVAQGEKIPRKAGQGMIKSDLFIINKTDLAPYVGADLSVMERDSKEFRGTKPFCFTNLKTDDGLDTVIDWLKHEVLMQDLG